MHLPKLSGGVIRDMIEVTKYEWHMGLTSFGGPVVQFQNFNNFFVQKHQWISDETYQELFAVAQALPGSASTKLLFIITLLHTSLMPAMMAFLYWSLPGAIGMFGLACGVGQIGQTLPAPVYGLLSGLNAATVGVIFRAAIQLSGKVITDKMSFALVFMGGAVGVVYTSLWYYPVLMVIGGCFAVIWDMRYLHKTVFWLRDHVLPARYRRRPVVTDAVELDDLPPVILVPEVPEDEPSASRRTATRGDKNHDDGDIGMVRVRAESVAESSATTQCAEVDEAASTAPDAVEAAAAAAAAAAERAASRRVYVGIAIVTSFLISFVVIIVIRAVVRPLPVTFSIFSNLYLAGTLIFGGGPVVIPLLREYIVSEGWVSSRDFTIGLAIVQAFPGPNFSFAIYLGALAYHNYGSSFVAGALVAYVAMYAPGMLVASGMFTFWHKLRKYRVITSILRGITCCATGLVWIALYRVWNTGFLSTENESGVSLGNDAWWVSTAATAYGLSRLWEVPTPICIAAGGVMGLARFAVMQGEGLNG
ncbi:chromate transporter-domain-containing protein [Dipodascopsis tothii]|uniref:chromate transporter-domain-containing protein n=1 Tax=Dipodascopsis tothii TaxID=44089 RepID=UPI0034CE6B14